jgi:hypothetical protein
MKLVGPQGTDPTSGSVTDWMWAQQYWLSYTKLALDSLAAVVWQPGPKQLKGTLNPDTQCYIIPVAIDVIQQKVYFNFDGAEPSWFQRGADKEYGIIVDEAYRKV